MNHGEAKRVGTLVAKLWPAVTTGQLEEVVDEVQKYKYDRALAVVKTCAKNEKHLFFNWPGLCGAFKDDAIKHADRKNILTHRRIVDWIRDKARERNDDRFAALDDENLITLHFGDCAQAQRDHQPTLTQEVIGTALGMILGHAVAAYREIGLDDASAHELARAIVGEFKPWKLESVKLKPLPPADIAKAQAKQLRELEQAPVAAEKVTAA